MKIICDCGAKYAFDAAPEMVRNPIAFACPTCGVDLSARINDEVRQQFGSAPATPHVGLAPATEIAPPPPGAKVAPVAPPLAPQLPPAPPRLSINLPSSAAPSQPTVPPPAPPQIRITLPGSEPAIPTPPPAVAAPPRIVLPPAASAEPAPIAPPVAPVAPPNFPPPPPQIPMPSDAPVVRLSRGGAAAAATPDVTDARFCPKHPQERVTEQCRVCAKPICPKCMQLFGYVCSPRCKEKAELQGVDVPKFAGQRDEAERKQWNKVGLIAKLAALLIITLLGVWFWYAWFGSQPRTAFRVRFEDEPALAGSSAICPGGQMVFIHGGKLARYDLKAKKEIWLRHLVDKKQIEVEANRELNEIYAANAKSGSDYRIKIPTLDKLISELLKSAEESLQLRVQGNNIWVANGGKVRRYDWATGEPKQEVDFKGSFTDGVDS